MPTSLKITLLVLGSLWTLAIMVCAAALGRAAGRNPPPSNGIDRPATARKTPRRTPAAPASGARLHPVA